jgi:prepilin-type N-terminal cleavage/methylation domain-containing protein
MGHREEVAVRRRDRGFTLLELIVTMMIISLSVGLAMPNIARSMEGVRVRAQIAGFSAMLRHGRELAISAHASHTVVVDQAAHRMVIRAGGTDGEVRQARALPADLTVAATPPTALAVRFEPQGTSSGGDFHVSSGSFNYRVTVAPLTGRVTSVRK